MRSSKLALRNAIIQGGIAVYAATVLIIELRDYKNPNDAAKALFYLTDQQLIGLAWWNSVKAGRTVYIYCKNIPISGEVHLKEIEEKNSYLNILGGAINARSWQVAVLWSVLLRTNIPKTFLYHITPSIVSSLSIYATGSTEAKFFNWKTYFLKAGIVFMANALDSLGSVVYTYSGLENPDLNNRKTLYGDLTDWVEHPVGATICVLGVTFGGPLLFPLLSAGVDKIFNGLFNRCCKNKVEGNIQTGLEASSYQSLEPNPNLKGFISGCCASIYNTLCCKKTAADDSRNSYQFRV